MSFSISIAVSNKNTDERGKISVKKQTRTLNFGKKLFLLLFVLFIVPLIFVQSAFPQNTYFKTYTEADGLVYNLVNHIFQDNDGYLWLVTSEGFSKFDGMKFNIVEKVGGLSDVDIKSICRDKNNNYWFASTNGVLKFDGKKWSHYTTENGLAHNDITTIFIDKESNIWFGTLGGVSKFNGENWTTYTKEKGLEFSWIRSIYEDKKGNIWFGARNGVSKFNSDRFFNYKTEEGFVGLNIDSILEDKEDNIWFASYEGGVSKFDGDSFTTYTTEDGLPNFVSAITEARNGDLLFSSFNGICKVDGEKLTYVTTKDGLTNIDVDTEYKDKEGNIWFGGSEGVFRFDGNEWSRFTTENGLVGNRIQSILEDKKGNIWFASRAGVFKFDGNELLRFTTENGLADDDINSIYEDIEGNIWFGTQGGISKYLGEKFINYNEDTGLISNSIRNIFEDKKGNILFVWSGGIGKYDGNDFTSYNWSHRFGPDNYISILEDKRGNIWFRASDYVYKFDGEKHDFFTLEDDVINYTRTFIEDKNGRRYIPALDNSGNFTSSILEDKNGRLWFPDHGGSYRFDGENWEYFTSKVRISDKCNWSIYEDSEGNLWFPTLNGVNKFDGEEFTSLTYEDGLDNIILSDIFEDKEGNLWFATYDIEKNAGKGVSKFDGDSFTTYTIEDGLVDNNIYSIIDDKKGNLWFISFLSGISRFDGQNFTAISVEDGLPDNKVNCYFEDKEGNIWFGTPRGISKFNGEIFTTYTTEDGLLNNNINFIRQEGNNYFIGTNKGLSRFDGKYFKSYTVDDGLFSNIVNNAFIDSKENLWISTLEKGITRYIIALDKPLHIPPPIHITGLRIFEKDISLRVEHEFKHNENYVNFDFVGICLASPDNVMYKYKLEGLDKDWHDTADRSTAYPFLPPGNYTFKVLARNDDGVWSEKPSELSFTILPPWWETWWFRTISALFIIGLAYSWYTIRTKNLAKRIRIETELRTAHEAQMSIMPQSDPQVEGLDISGACISTYEVSGDFFDYIWLNEEKTIFGIAVGDVSGKAMKAAITAVMSSGMIYTNANETSSIKEIMTRVNTPLYFKTEDNMFLALLLASIDTTTKELTFTNAGLNKPLLKTGNSVVFIEGKGTNFLLGIIKDHVYHETKIQLKSDSVLIFSTDGITDAQNHSEEFYGEDRFKGLLEKMETSTLTAKEIKERIIKDVKRFSGTAPQFDDITLVVVKIA